MKNIILGMAVGDALGVPYEFIKRDDMTLNPCVGMIGFGTHHQPIGTWSDDTSMALCIVDSLCNELNYTDIANKFSEWFNRGLWTPHGEVFDFGNATHDAISKWDMGNRTPVECGGLSVSSNGNGSVMRTLVLVPYIEDKDVYRRFDVVRKVSSITHAHWISLFSCFLVCEYAIAIRQGFDKIKALDIATENLDKIKEVELGFGSSDFSEMKYGETFTRLISLIQSGNATDNDFRGSGFARDTAITSIWCIITTDSYEAATLKAVNFGEDTDTTGCVTGGLGGVLYGADEIPTEWVNNLVRKEDILELVNKYDSIYETT